jgi:hypothetical protein
MDRDRDSFIETVFNYLIFLSEEPEDDMQTKWDGRNYYIFGPKIGLLNILMEFRFDHRADLCMEMDPDGNSKLAFRLETQYRPSVGRPSFDFFELESKQICLEIEDEIFKPWMLHHKGQALYHETTGPDGGTYLTFYKANGEHLLNMGETEMIQMRYKPNAEEQVVLFEDWKAQTHEIKMIIPDPKDLLSED